MSTSNTANSLQLKRHIHCRPDRAFAAWTSQDQVARWMGPSNTKIKSATIDLRVGGAYSFTFDTPHGEMTVRGQYREIEAPKKLSFTWQWQDDEDWTSVTSLVTVEFAAKDGGTEVQLTHTGLPGADSAARHEHGWQGTLDKLAIGFDVVAEFCSPGRFNWNELLTSDVAAARTFYTQAFGWDTVEVPGLKGPYTLFKKNGTEVGGMMKHPREGTPPAWLAYVTVESVDASAAQIKKLGGNICAGPMDIPDVGRIAVAEDPQGAAFGIFQPAK